MAQSDFDFVTIKDARPMVGGPQGTALLHSSLSSPLTGEGLWCRSLKKDGGTGNAGVKALCKGEEYRDIPNTKAVSIRAWMRMNAYYNSSSLRLIGRADDSDQWRGYWLEYTTISNLPKVRLIAQRGTNPTVLGTVDAATGFTWRKYRLDIVPLLDDNDILKAYAGEGPTGGETWTLLMEATVSKNDTNHIPVTVGTRYGYATSIIDNNYYIDRFQIFTEGV